MFHDDLDSRLEGIVQSIKDGASLIKEASSASNEFKKNAGIRSAISSSISKNLLKMSSQVRIDADEITYSDLKSLIQGTDTTQVYVSDNPLVKVAAQIRRRGPSYKQEKIASLMNAAVGLKLLEKKIQKN